jgi:pimeloyl-ACP methyl ester carboxylesterase
MHLRIWGREDAPKIFMVHGWGDTSASYQFVVDAFQGEWRVIALDWRGFGKSEWNQDTYWYPDYFADLDALLDHYSPHEAVRLVGHSMGGTVASIYTGARAERVAQFVNLEGGSLLRSKPGDGPSRVQKWLGQLRGERKFRVYADRAAFAGRLMRDNPRLTRERAAYLAERVTDPCDGGVRFAADPCHYWMNPVYYSIDEAMASWRLATAAVLWIGARDSFVMKAFEGREDEFRARLDCFANLREVILEDSGHNMHHDQPETVARLIEEFFV